MPNVDADGPQSHHHEERDHHDPLVARERAECGQRLPCRGGRTRRRGDLRPRDLVEHPRQQRHRQQRRQRTGQQPAAKPDLDAVRASDLGSERVGGHRRQPETGRQRETRDAGKHQERPEPRARRVVGACACRPGERYRQRIQDARSRGVARKGRRDHRVDQEQAVREPERRPAERLHHGMSDPLAEPALDHRAGHQERRDDEDDGAVGKSRPCRLGRDDASEDRDGDREQGCGQDRQGPDHDRENGPGKQREQVPRRER